VPDNVQEAQGLAPCVTCGAAQNDPCRQPSGKARGPHKGRERRVLSVAERERAQWLKVKAMVPLRARRVQFTPASEWAQRHVTRIPKEKRGPHASKRQRAKRDRERSLAEREGVSTTVLRLSMRVPPNLSKNVSS
jgi:hypothetical protein